MAAILQDLRQRWPRERAAQLLERLVGDRVVVAIKEPDKIRMKWAVAGQKLRQEKGFKEPRRVRQVPFGGAGFRTRLHHHVLGRERLAELFRLLPHTSKLRS